MGFVERETEGTDFSLFLRMFTFNTNHQRGWEANITSNFSDLKLITLVLNTNGALTAPSMNRPGCLYCGCL